MTDRALLLDALLADPTKGVNLPRGEAAALLIALAPVQTALQLAATVSAPTIESVRGSLPMLKLKKVAERSGKSERWWRENWRTEIPTATKKGRTVLIPEEDFEKWRHK